jgi:hypothetical protein
MPTPIEARPDIITAREHLTCIGALLGIGA